SRRRKQGPDHPPSARDVSPARRESRRSPRNRGSRPQRVRGRVSRVPLAEASVSDHLQRGGGARAGGSNGISIRGFEEPPASCFCAPSDPLRIVPVANLKPKVVRSV